MSTFKGKLLEDSLDFIRIDQFQPQNHDGEAFLLSHFHTDHFKGMFEDDFSKVLTDNENKMIYCTDKTKVFILNYRNNRGRIPEHKICAVRVDELFYLKKDEKTVAVTPVSAGHCPGSVMFLFEYNVEEVTKRVLYTGDFRINPNDWCKINALHYKDRSLKEIKTLYLDTTFADPNWLSFPSRKQSEEECIRIARDWLDQSPNHRVGIWYNSYYGLEHLLIDVSKALKTKICVRDDESYINYSCIPELHSALCQKNVDSRLHLCSVKEGNGCRECTWGGSNVKTIKPCAQSFNTDQLELGIRKEQNRLVRIAYSLHCSLEELIETVNYLKPDVVHPCALPNNICKRQVLQNLYLDLEKLKQERRERKEEIEPSTSTSPPAKRFCLSSSPGEEEPTLLEKRSSFMTYLSSGEEEENKPLSQNSIDSPPL